MRGDVLAGALFGLRHLGGRSLIQQHSFGELVNRDYRQTFT